MRALLPSNALLHEVCLALAGRAEPVYLVGGYVRDWLLGQASHDLDFAVDGPAIAVAREVADAFRGAFVLLDREHDTARAILRQRGQSYSVDFARIRGPSILEDLASRDFTVNAIAVHVRDIAAPRPPLLDPTGGQDDLRARRIRVAYAAAFQDDPLRMLRAVRQAAALGFQIAADTEALIRQDAPLITRPSAERVRDELVQIMGLRAPHRHVLELDRLGLLEPVLPEVAALQGESLSPGVNAYQRTLATLEHLVAIQAYIAGDAGSGLAAEAIEALSQHRAQLRAHNAAILSDTRPRALTLRFAALLQHVDAPGDPGQAVATLRRLRFSNAEINLAQQVIAYQRLPAALAATAPIAPRSLYRFWQQLGEAGLDLLQLALATSQAAREGDGMAWAQLCAAVQQLLGYYAQEWPRIQAMPPLVDGADLMRALQLKGGPLIGELLEGIREAQAVGEVGSAAEALSLARARLHPDSPAKV